MKTAMKSGLAFAAIALVLMVAVVGVSLYDSDDASDAAVESTFTIQIKDAKSANMPGVLLDGVTTELGTAIYTDSNGKAVIPYYLAAGETIVFQLDGFEFNPNQINVDSTITAGQTVNVFSTSVMVTLTVQANSGQAAQGSLEYGYMIDEDFVSVGTAAVIDGKAIVPKYKNEPAVYVQPNDGMYVIEADYGELTFAGDKDTEGIYKVTGTSQTIKAKESLTTIATVTANNAALPGVSFDVKTTSGDDAETVFSGVTGMDGKFLALRESTSQFVWFANETGATFDGGSAASVEGGYKDIYSLTGTSVTAKALETKFTITLTDHNGKFAINGANITVTYVEPKGPTYEKTVDFENELGSAGVYSAFLINGVKYTKVEVSNAYDVLGNEFTVNDVEPSSATVLPSKLSITAVESVITVKGDISYVDGAAKVADGAMSIGLSTGYVADASAGSFSFYAIMVPAGTTMTAQSDLGRYTLITPTYIFDDDQTVDFTYNYKVNEYQKFKLGITLENTEGTDISGTNYTVQVVAGTSITNASWNAAQGCYIVDLVRGTTYGVIVKDNYLADEVSFEVPYYDNVDYVTAVVDDVFISGYVYAKWVADDNNTRPLDNAEVLSIYDFSVTTDENGYYEATVPSAVSFQIYDEESQFTGKISGKYWSATIPAYYKNSDQILNKELLPVSYDVTGSVAAYNFGSSGSTTMQIASVTAYVGDEAVDVTISADKMSYGINLNAYRGQSVTVTVTDVEVVDPLFTVDLGDDGVSQVVKAGTATTVMPVIYTDEAYLAGTVYSYNDYAYDGILTLTPADSPRDVDEITVAVKGGKYHIAVDIDEVTQQLYRVAFVEEKTGKDLRIFDGTYDQYNDLDIFRLSLIPANAKTPAQVANNGSVTQGTLSTTIYDKYVVTANNANFKSVESVIAGTVRDVNGDIPEIEQLMFSVTGGSIYIDVVEGAFFDVQVLTSAVTVMVSDLEDVVYTVNSPKDPVSIKDAKSISVILGFKSIEVKLIDAFENKITDEIEAYVYFQGEPKAQTAVTFKNGSAFIPYQYFEKLTAHTYVGIEVTFVLQSLVYSLTEETATFVISQPNVTAYTLQTNEGKITGKVNYVNNPHVTNIEAAQVSVDGILAINDDIVAVSNGTFSGIITKDLDDFYTAFMIGDFALLEDSEFPSINEAKGKDITLFADYRTVYGHLMDGQGEPLAAIDVTFVLPGEYNLADPFQDVTITATTDALGLFEFALPNGFSVRSYDIVYEEGAVGEARSNVLLDNGYGDFAFTLDTNYDLISETLDTDIENGFVHIHYEPATTAQDSSYFMYMKTNQNRIVISFVNDEGNPYVGLLVDVLGMTTDGEMASIFDVFEKYNGDEVDFVELFQRYTNMYGQIYIDGAMEDADTYILFNPYIGFFTEDAISETVEEPIVVSTVTIEGEAYYVYNEPGLDNVPVEDGAELEFYSLQFDFSFLEPYKGYKVFMNYIDEIIYNVDGFGPMPYTTAVVSDGIYSIEVPVMNGYNVVAQMMGLFPLFGVEYDGIYAGEVSVYKLPNTNNVGYTYSATPVDFGCKPVTGLVDISSTSGYVHNDFAEGVLNVTVFEGKNPVDYEFEFMTDANGVFTVYIPEAYLGEIDDVEAETLFDVEYWSYAYYSIEIEGDYTYDVVYPGEYESFDIYFIPQSGQLLPFAYYDELNEEWTLNNLYLHFASVEYRILVEVSADDFGVADMPVMASQNGKLYTIIGNTDADGYLVVDGVDVGTYFKIQTGDDFKPVKAKQFDGINNVEFVLTYVVDPTPQPEDDVYTLFVNGKRMKDLEAGQAYTVALMNDANGAKIVVSNINKNQTIFLADQKNTVFKYWRLADGSTSTLEAITFVAGGDQVKAVGNQYAFTAVFEDSTKIVVEDPDNADTPVEPEDNKKGIDTTVLILGAVAVAIAVIAVVAAVVVGRK